jgi:hypothetical protein
VRSELRQQAAARSAHHTTRALVNRRKPFCDKFGRRHAAPASRAFLDG